MKCIHHIMHFQIDNASCLVSFLSNFTFAIYFNLSRGEVISFNTAAADPAAQVWTCLFRSNTGYLLYSPVWG